MVASKQRDVAERGQEVCVTTEAVPSESPKIRGRHFEAVDILVGQIGWQSVDALKGWFRVETQKSDWLAAYRDTEENI